MKIKRVFLEYDNAAFCGYVAESVEGRGEGRTKQEAIKNLKRDEEKLRGIKAFKAS